MTCSPAQRRQRQLAGLASARVRKLRGEDLTAKARAMASAGLPERRLRRYAAEIAAYAVECMLNGDELLAELIFIRHGQYRQRYWDEQYKFLNEAFAPELYGLIEAQKQSLIEQCECKHPEHLIPERTSCWRVESWPEPEL